MTDGINGARNTGGMNRRRPSVFWRVLGSLVAWGLFFGLMAGIFGGWAYYQFTTPGSLTEEKVSYFARGSSRSEIAIALKDQGIISDARIFGAAAALKGLRGTNLRPGEYRFVPGMSMKDVLALMNAGRVVTYKITIPEGWTTQMAAARIAENDVLSGTIAKLPPEGGLMADTFVFARGTTRQGLVDEMADAQSRLLDKLWSERLPGFALKSKEELVTLASIVEKETAKPDERPLVASVFLNRLKKGMRLQSDPTIIYGLVGGAGKLDRPISRADIDAATPYNTYQIDGLPPGPIGNPGKAALEAVLSPAAASYLYFVADGTGGHAFASTLEEHNANVEKWRKVEANTAQPPAPPAVVIKPALVQPQVSSGLDNLKLDTEQSKTAETNGADAKPAVAPVDATAILDSTPLDLKPGAIIRVGKQLVPIPAPKPSQ
jgi:UPF0755 protein